MDKHKNLQSASSMDSSNQAGSGSQSSEVPDSSSVSDSAGTNQREALSDEEIILASNRPKRSAGRKKFRETRHPVYRGVRRRNNDKWVCELREPNKKTRIWLGTYETAEMAARAHDVAALVLRGKAACLNFADSVWRLPKPRSTDPRDIRKAAAEAAEMFRPDEPSEGAGSSSGSRPPPETAQHAVPSLYIDEEEEFGMPGLLASMAEGLLLSPPRTDETGENLVQDGEDESELTLWSFSI